MTELAFFVTLLTVLLIVSAGTLLVLQGSRTQRQAMQRWQGVAQEWGLRPTAPDVAHGRALAGAWDDQPLVLELHHDASGAPWTEIRVGTGRRPESLAPRRAGRPLPGPYGSGEGTGDPAFDPLRFGGRVDHALAVLGDDATREQVRRLVPTAYRNGRPLGEVRDGRVVLRAAGWITRAEILEPMVERAAKLADRLTVADDQIVPWLAQNARASALPGVRYRCLHALLQHEPPRALVEPALGDPDPVVRLLAARYLGEFEVVVETAQGLLEGPLRGFGDGEGWEEVRPLALHVARALGTVEAPEIQPVLIALLEAPSNDVRIEALASLGEVGTVEAVQPILELAERPFPKVRRAARQAAARIQSRVEHGEAGSLSLAEPSQGAGALSVSNNAGGLEIADEAPPERLATEPVTDPDRARPRRPDHEHS